MSSFHTLPRLNRHEEPGATTKARRRLHHRNPIRSPSPRRMSPDIFAGVHEKRNIDEKFEGHMGCVSGLLQFFDRPHFLAGKRIHSSKRFPVLSTSGSTSPSEKSEVFTVSLAKETSMSSVRNSAGQDAFPFHVFELTDGLNAPWKLQEAPRFSLDSCASVDASGNLEILKSPAASEEGANLEKKRRSPSVVARLMGLETLPYSGIEPPKRAELRRSVSESRVHRAQSQITFQKPYSKTHEDIYWPQKMDCSEMTSQEHELNANLVGSFYGEIEKRLRMRGIEKPARDLEKLKHILEALQLKGLLHSKSPEPQNAAGRPPIVLIKPASASPLRLSGRESPIPLSRSVPTRRPPPPSPPKSTPTNVRHDRQRPSSPEPVKAPTSSTRSSTPRRPRRGECKTKNPLPQPRITTVNSAKKPHSTAEMPSLRSKVNSPATDITLTSPSPSNLTTGRNLLERCDKLLHSIAALTSSADKVIAAEQRTSPVSVLDPSLSDDICAVDGEDHVEDREEDHGVGDHSVKLTDRSGSIDGLDRSEPDYAYVDSILRESSRHRSAAEVFAAVEKRHHGCDSSSPLHRRLVFDAVTEILDRKRARDAEGSIREVWDELRGVQETAAAVEGDVMDVVRGLTRRELRDSEQGWVAARRDEMSEAALCIERQVFKDLVVDTIREIASLAGRVHRGSFPRRKLLF